MSQFSRNLLGEYADKACNQPSAPAAEPAKEPKARPKVPHNPAPVAAAAARDEEATEPTPAQVRAALRKLRYSGDYPSLDGFKPAAVVGLPRRPGDHEHNTAYKSSDGCVAYFYDPDPNFTDVQFKWEGKGKCNGKPLSGEGWLMMKRTLVGGKVPRTFVHSLQGTFKGGVLQGRGIKVNFSFDGAGKAVDDTYLFQGEFANSVLNGPGEARWTGPASAHPSAWVKQATFKDGVPVTRIVFGRLHPLPGIESDIQTLVVNKDGEIYRNQHLWQTGPSTGQIFFDGDPAEWTTEIYTFDDAPVMAGLKRVDQSESPRTFAVDCQKFEFGPDSIACDKGFLLEQSSGPMLVLTEKPYTIPLPFNTSGVPFRVKANESVMVGGHNQHSPMTCSEDLSECSGNITMDVDRSLMYFMGPAEYRNRHLSFTSAKLLSRSNAMAGRSGSDRTVASCSKFSDALSCERGIIYYGDTRASGAWELEGVRHTRNADGEDAYEATEATRVSPKGWQRVTFADGRWAEAVVDGKRITDVGDCGVPNESGEVKCHLEGGRISFDRQRPSSRAEASRPEPYQWSSPPPVFVPTPVPQRQTFILKGMP